MTQIEISHKILLDLKKLRYKKRLELTERENVYIILNSRRIKFNINKNY